MKWNYEKLEDVAKLVSGRTPEREKKEYYADYGIPWVKIENLDQGYVTETTEYLSDKGKEKVNLVPENSVLFSIVGTVGKVGIAVKELATNQQIVALIFDETKVLPMYGYYFLRHHAEKIKKLSNQTTMSLISRKTLGQYRIYVPDSLEVQLEIVKELDRFEAYTEKKKVLRKRMEQYEEVLFQKIFGQESRYHEKLYMKEFLEEPIVAGISKNDEPKEDFPCIRGSEFSKSYLPEEKERQWQTMETDELDIALNCQVRQGDILLRNGLLMFMDELKNPVWFERSILRIRTRQDQLLPEVLYAYLNQPDIRRSLYRERKEGDSRKRPIRGSELERMELPYFTMEKQKEFADCLARIRRIERSLDKEILYAGEVFCAVCSILLSGQKLSEKKDKNQEKLSVKPVSTTQVSRIAENTEDMYVIPDNENASKEAAVSHIILAVLCGWSPLDERTGEYCRKRQEVFRKAQPFFQPVAISYVSNQGQKEYLLERDFLAYYSADFCREGKYPLDKLRDILAKMENDKFIDAHLAFQGETGICTEADWNVEIMKQMAKEGLLLLAEYSGLGACRFLFAR